MKSLFKMDPDSLYRLLWDDPSIEIGPNFRFTPIQLYTKQRAAGTYRPKSATAASLPSIRQTSQVVTGAARIAKTAG